MTTTLDRLLGAAGALVIAVVASSADLLDNLTRRTGLDATVLLLITLALVIVAMVAIAALMAWRQMGEDVEYRTICKTTMAHSVKRARASVPEAPGLRHKTTRRRDEFDLTAAAVRAAGTRAADLEFDRGTPSINPHQAPSRWAVLWATSREIRLMERAEDRAAPRAAQQAVHTRTQQGA